MHVRILVLMCVVSGLVLGLVWELVHVRRVVFFLVLWIDVDDACMDGSALDDIRVVSNSFIQSFTEYHDNSCARLNALPNSRVGSVDFPGRC